MMQNTNNNLYQWFIITVIGGKEDSIIENLKEKISNFGYNDLVKEIRVFKTNLVKEETFKKDDPSLPKNLRNTKTTKWETLPNGLYKKTSTRVVNKFPGYVFIHMIMNSEVWYCIRNTNGVLGFVGSSGKGALPIPISIDEYQVVANIPTNEATTPTTPTTDEAPMDNVHIYHSPFKVGNTVQITEGAFAGENGVVQTLNDQRGSAIIQIEVFGRPTNIEIPYSSLKTAE